MLTELVHFLLVRRVHTA